MGTSGTVVTFYSYKGGVGRSFLLANLAVTLARWGYRTLCIDWDLEAPGLEQYFHDDLGDSTLTDGLVDLIKEFEAGKLRAADWPAFASPISPGTFAGSLHLIPAGKQDGNYAARVQSIDWERLYDEGLGAFFEELRSAWIEEFDFVLIDSRTGITDIGGICTIQFPDILIPVLAANRQNLTGSMDVVRRANERRHSLPIDRPRLLVLPVLSRFETQVEYELSQEWLQRVSDALGPITDGWRHKDVRFVDVLAQIKIPYIPFWSYGEKLAVMAEPKPAPAEVSYAIQSVAALVARRLEANEMFLDDRDGYLSAAQKSAGDLQTWVPVRVYVAAGSDLGEHKRAVINAIQRLRDNRFRVYTWDGPINPGKPLIEMLPDDFDIFVGLFGFRYGTVLPGSDRSGLEFEYRRAADNGIPTLALLLADDAPISAKDIDRGAAADRIDSLRTQIVASGAVDFFRTPEEAASKALVALNRVLAERDSGRISGASSPRFYISYRRPDHHVAARINEKLAARFGRDSVFSDFSSIPLGTDFRKLMRETVRSATAVLATIGPHWEARNAEGGRRIDDPHDFIRLELDTALANGVLVIPVLIDGADVPVDLPPSLRRLSKVQGLRIGGGVDGNHDLERLVRACERIAEGIA